MEVKPEYYKNKPKQNQNGKQLFSIDINSEGAKKFVFETYENIYNISTTKKSYFNEDNTFAKQIKLFIDIDVAKTFDSQLERNLYANNLFGTIMTKIIAKLFQDYKQNDAKFVCLISDTLLKCSLHIIFPEVIFENIYDIGHYLKDIDGIDLNPYKIGCFRMHHNNKYGKDNELILFRTNLENKNDYQIFLASSITGAIIP
jgi:hypothetical protein